MVALIESVARKIIDYTIHNSDLEGSLDKYNCLIIDESNLFCSSSLELIHLTHWKGHLYNTAINQQYEINATCYIDLSECDMGSNM